MIVTCWSSASYWFIMLCPSGHLGLRGLKCQAWITTSAGQSQLCCSLPVIFLLTSGEYGICAYQWNKSKGIESCEQNEELIWMSFDCLISWVRSCPRCWFIPEYNISAAAISIFSLAFMILGSLCVLGSCTGKGKGRDYLLKPAGMFFAFSGGFSWLTFPCCISSLEPKHRCEGHIICLCSPAGLCAFISLEVMRQSVKRMIESEDTIWIEYYYAWSFACACVGFVLLFLTGIALLLLSMPQMPRNPWETCMDAEQEPAEW